MYPIKNHFHGLLIAVLFINSCGIAQAKSVYVINNTITSQLRAYKVDGTSLAYQTDYNCESVPGSGVGAIGIAIDESEYGGFLFVTFEHLTTSINWIEVVDAKTMRYVDTVTAAGASNLAGIVVDKGKSKIYAMDRYTNRLFSYSWEPSSKTLTPDFSEPNYYIKLQGMQYGDPNGAFGIALDEENGRLYVSDNTNRIKYYDTNNWSKVGEVNVTCNAISVAIDVNRQLLYYGSMGDYGQGDPNLYQHNLSSHTEYRVNVGSGCSVAGIAVDQNSSLVYLTTYGGPENIYYPRPPNDRLMIYDVNLVKQPSNRPWESGDVGNPAGVCVPSGNVECKPPLFKDDNIPGGDCVLSGSPITYTIAYDFNGPGDSNVVITDFLPIEVDYSSSPDGNYNAAERTVTWDIGTVPPDGNGTVTLAVYANDRALPCGVITNRCEIKGYLMDKVFEMNTPVCAWGSGIIYVDHNRTAGRNNGMSWQDAYLDLQKALDRAYYGCSSAIWVAAGTYEPCVPRDYPTFQLINGVSVYGHFAGNETSLSQRNLNDPGSETILDGNSNNNVVTASNLSQVTSLDGFTITGASSAGIKIENAGLTVKNCLITGNDSGTYGINADFNNNNTLPETRIENSIVRDNWPYGIYLCDANSPVVITNSRIHGSDYGIDIENSSLPPVVTGCRIFENYDVGIYDNNAPATIINNWIYKNTSYGISLQSPRSVTIRNNTIVGNSSYGIYCSSGTAPAITSCIIWGNDSNSGSGQLAGCSATYSCIQGYSGSDTTNIKTDPCFTYILDGDDFHLKPASLCIDKGDPCFSDFNDKDIDGECRIIDGDNNGTSIVDMGADELYRPKADFNHDNIVNFIDFAMFATSWATAAGGQDYNDLYDLEDDNVIDIYDLAIFCDNWLWIAPWSPLYGTLGIGGMDMVIEGGTEESLALAEDMSAEVVAAEQIESIGQPMSGEQIQALIDWTEQLWQSDPNIRAMVNQADYNRVLESLKAQLND